MKRTLKELYGVGILFFYFLKWPFVFGYPYLHFINGLRENFILDALWLYCIALIVKDIYIMIKNKKINRCDIKKH